MKEKLMKLPKWAVVIIAVVVLAGFLQVMRLQNVIFYFFPSLPGYGNSMVGELVGGIYAFVILVWFGYSEVIREKGAGFLRSCYIGGFMVGYCLIELAAQILMIRLTGKAELQPVLSVLFFTVTMFLIGWGEEIICRGIMLNLFLDRFSKTKKGILGAIILDGVLFGAVHLTNIFAGVSVVSACIQAISAGLLGIIFSAIYARSRNIWICIITHALTDFAALMGTGIFGNGTAVDGINNISYINLAAVPVLLIPCLVLLRKSKLEEMEKRANGIVVFETYEEADKMATVSLVLGVLGIIFGLIGGYGIGCGVVGILGSCISKKIKPEQNGVAMAGMITSIIGTVLSVFMLVVFAILYGAMDLSQGGLF